METNFNNFGNYKHEQVFGMMFQSLVPCPECFNKMHTRGDGLFVCFRCNLRLEKKVKK
jgi:tRNA(Ile2) C34 agmatinyltransferase TiaS